MTFYQHGFENQEWGRYNPSSQIPSSHSDKAANITDEISRKGSWSARVHVESDWDYSDVNNSRSQLVITDPDRQWFWDNNYSVWNNEFWFSFSFYAPENWEPDSVPEGIMEFHRNLAENPGDTLEERVEYSGSPLGAGKPLQLQVRGEDLIFVNSYLDSDGNYKDTLTSDDIETPSVQIQPGEWHDMVFHIKWTKESDNEEGIMDIWVNGNKVYGHRGNTAVNDVAPPRPPKFGIYKWRWPDKVDLTSRTYFFDQFKFGKSDETYESMSISDTGTTSDSDVGAVNENDTWTTAVLSQGSTSADFSDEVHTLQLISTSSNPVNYYFSTVEKITTTETESTTSSTETTQSTSTTSSTSTTTTSGDMTKYQDINPGAENADALTGVGFFQHAFDNVKDDIDWYDYDGDGKATRSDIEKHIEEASNNKIHDVPTKPGSIQADDHVNLADFVESYSGSNRDAITEAVQQNSGVYIPEGEVIEFEAELYLTDVSDTVIYGGGTLSFTGDPGGSYWTVFRLIEAENVGLYGFTLDGSNSTAADDDNWGGIAIPKGKNIDVRNIEVTGIGFQDQDQPHSLSTNACKDIQVVGCHIHDTGGKGIGIYSNYDGDNRGPSGRARVVNNLVENTGEDGLFGGTEYPDDKATIIFGRNRVVRNSANYGCRIGGGSTSGGSGRGEEEGRGCPAVIYKNTFVEPTPNGSKTAIEGKTLDSTYYAIVENRTVDGSINIRETDSASPLGGLIAGNVIENADERNGIRLLSEPNNVTVRNNTMPGLTIEGGENFWIYDNDNTNSFENISGASNVNRSSR